VSLFQNFPLAPGSFFTGSVSSTENKFGWVVGAGVESSLGGNLTAKIEYLYMDLGSIGTALNGVFPAQGFFLPNPFTLSANSNIHDNIIRAGLNYRFGPSAGPASAYDAMAAVPPPIYSWTGFYVGVNAGYGFGNDHSQIDLTAPGGTSTSEPGVAVTPRGGLGGVQVGYNWQAAPHWLAGFEADLQGTAQNDTVCSSVVCFNQTGAAGGPGFEIITVQHQLDYFGTLRGRLGYVHNNTLFYGTGGLAFGHVRETVHLSTSGGTLLDQGTTKDLTGYVVGGGIEASLWGGWSAKGEYLYMNLGNLSQNIDASALQAGTSIVSNSTVRDHIVRLGLNYHIGAAPY
jgi:outer membrane immunogenic protein